MGVQKKPKLVDFYRHEDVFTNLRNIEIFAMGKKTHFSVKTLGLFPGIAPEKGALILFDDWKGGTQKGRWETLALVLRQGGHPSQAILVRVGKLFISFKIKGSHAHQFVVYKGPQMKSELICVTFEHTIFEGPIRAKYPMPDMVGVDRLNS